MSLWPYALRGDQLGTPLDPCSILIIPASVLTINPEDCIAPI